VTLPLSKIVTGAAFAMLFAVSSAEAATMLTPGIYDLETTVTSASLVSGTSCTAGADWQAWLTYPGSNKSGGVMRHAAVGTSQDSAVILTLPKTPAPGMKTWQGSYTAAVKNSGGTTTWLGSFEQNVNVADAFSFFGSLTLTNYQTSGGVCDFIFNTAGVYVGPLP
jgi:hypothetical protein